MKKILIITAALIATAANIFAMDFINISDSNNWRDEHPALIALDEQDASFAQLIEGETSGRITLELESQRRIMGYKVDAAITNGAWLSLAYDEDGVLKRIPASYITGTDGKSTVLFQKDGIVAQNISLLIDGESCSEAKIYEFELISGSTADFNQKAVLNLIDEDGTFPYYYDSNFLIDGHIGTSWWGVSSYANSTYGYSSNQSKTGRTRGDVRCGDGFGFEHEQNGFPSWGFDFGGGWNNNQRQIYAEFQTEEAEHYDNFSYYLSNPAWGNLRITAITNSSEIEIGCFSMNDRAGWHTVPLDAVDEQVTGVRIAVEGTYGTMGGVGEIALWKSDEYKKPVWTQLSGIEEIGKSVNSIYKIDEDKANDSELVIAIDSLEDIEGLPVSVNGRTLYNYDSESLGSVKIFRIGLDENTLWGGNNFISIDVKTNQRVLSAVIRETENDSDFIFKQELSGYEKILNFDGNYYVNQLVIVSESDASYDIEIYNGWNTEYLTDYESNGDIRIYNFSNPKNLSRLKINGDDGTYSASLKGDSNEYGTYIKVMPESDYELGSERMFLHGITDAALTDTIKVNGHIANKLGNYFWIPLSQIGINKGGIFDIEVTIERGWHHTINSYKTEYMYEVESNMLNLDETEDIVYTSEPDYTVSGSVERSWFFNPDLYINDQKVSVNGTSFSYVINLEDGLNVICVELKTGIFRQTIALQYLYVYKYQGTLNIVIDKPVDGSYISDNNITVSGRIQNALELQRVSVNGVDAIIDGNCYTSVVPVASDVQNITVTALDSVIGSSSKSITVYRDMDAPVISDVFPDNGYWIADHSIKIKGNVADQTRSQVYVNGYLATQIDGYFEADTALVEGSNSISIVARDQAGNENHLPVFIVNSDTISPHNIEVNANVSGWTNNNRPTISFSADDDGIGIDHYEVSVAGRAFIEQASPFQTATIEDGEDKEIIVRAVDKLGNYDDNSISVDIDTLPPDTPSTFRAIPGNSNVVLAWSENDDETESYNISYKNDGSDVTVNIERDSAVLDEETGTGFLELDLKESPVFSSCELENGEHYEFSVIAIDHAGNKSFEKTVGVTVGVAIQEYIEDEFTIVEYESVQLVIQPDSLSDDIESVYIYEIESEAMRNVSDIAPVSPIYSFNVMNSDGELLEHAQFDDNFLCDITYIEDLLPVDFPEKDLRVCYFDNTWSQWVPVKSSKVNTESNTIHFVVDHFSQYTIIPTVADELSPQELADIKFNRFPEETKHQYLSVSPQGGGVSTSMTEFVLPGKGGLDLEIRRLYDSGTAKQDSQALAMNVLDASVDILTDETGSELSERLSDIAGSSTAALVNSFRNAGDFAFSMGQGWRLNFPYMKMVGGVPYVRTSTGSMYSLNQMEFLATSSDSGNITDVADPVFWFHNSEGESFRLQIMQSLNEFEIDSSTSNSDELNQNEINISSFSISSAVLYEKDGREYHFDSAGRLLKITDPNGNKIVFEYSDFKITKIIDTFGREVYFSYKDFGSTPIPQITAIWVETDGSSGFNSNNELGVNYSHLDVTVDSSNQTIGLPVLTKATDVQGRDFIYSYGDSASGEDAVLLLNGELTARLPLSAMNSGSLTDGTDIEDLANFGTEDLINYSEIESITGEAQCSWTFPLRSVSGPGIGVQEGGIQ